MNQKIFIVGINGSPRKNGNTARFLRRILNSAQKKGARVKLIHLVDENIKPCLGCYSISEKECKYPCIQKDNMENIYRLLLRADGIVLGSPSYWYNVSGLMKNFIDRLCSLENNGFLLRGKVAVAVVSAEETGGGEVSHYLTSVMGDMGCLIPPFAAIYFNNKGKESWYLKDLEIAGKNIVGLCKTSRRKKLVYPKR